MLGYITRQQISDKDAMDSRPAYKSFADAGVQEVKTKHFDIDPMQLKDSNNNGTYGQSINWRD